MPPAARQIGCSDPPGTHELVDSLTAPEERSAVLDTSASGIYFCRISRMTEIAQETHEDE